MVKLLAYTNNDKIFLQEDIEELCGVKFEYITELPENTRVGEMVVLDLDEVSEHLLREMKYARLNYVFLTDTLEMKSLKRFISMGGDLYVLKSLGKSEFLDTLKEKLLLMETYKIFHFFGRGDMELFRMINRAGNGEKIKLTEIVFGSTSENTMDVSLSRLRKKLRDPDIGNDFFRIITDKGRLYLVNQLNNYEVPEDLR